MAITSVNDIVYASAANSQRLLISKASITNQLAGGYCSLWRATGIPAQGAIPGAAATCNNSLLGSMGYTAPPSGNSSYISRASVSDASATGGQLFIVDRLAHMGGLSGINVTSQTVGVDCTGNTSNMALRKGAADYSDVQWWIEIYTDIGTNAATATVTYTNSAGTGSRTTTLTVGGASPANRASRMFPIIPTNNNSEFIQSVQSISLSANTGVAGSFGITATRTLFDIGLYAAFIPTTLDWAGTKLAKVGDMACLNYIKLCGTTASNQMTGLFDLIQG